METHQVRIINMNNQKEVCDNIALELVNSQRSLVISDDKFNAIVLHLQNPDDYVDPKFKHWLKSKRFQLMDFPTLQLTDVLVIPKLVSKKDQDGEINYRRVVHTGQLFDVMKHVHDEELNHQGHQKCVQFVQKHYYGVTRSYIETFCNSCQYCNESESKAKSRRPMRNAVQSILPGTQLDQTLASSRTTSKKFKRAAVWAFFQMSADRTRTICNLCHAELVFNQGTSSMRNHMHHMHKNITLQGVTPPGTTRNTMPNVKVNGTPTTATATTATCTPSTSEGTTSKVEGSGDAENTNYSISYDSVTSSIALMCVQDLLPIATVEGQGFLKMMRTLKTDFSVADKRVVILYLLITQSRVKQLLMQEVEHCPVVLSAERWETQQGTKFLSMSGHFITGDWRLENRLLTTATVPDNNNASNGVLVQMQTLIEEFKLENIVGLVDVPNKQLDANDMSPSSMLQVKCYGEILNSVIEDSLELPPLQRVVASAERLLKHLQYSPSVTAALQEQQRQLEIPDAKLHQDQFLRWNSTYNMLAAVLQLRLAINAVLEDDTITKASDRQYIDITGEFWDILEALGAVLEPLAEAIEILAKEEMPSLSAIFVLLHRLMADLKDFSYDSGITSLVKKKLVSGLCTQLNIDSDGLPTNGGLLSPPMVAAVLDPRFKSLKFLPQKKRDIVYNHLKSLAEKCTIQAPSSDSTNGATRESSTSSSLRSPPSKKRLLDCLQGDIELTQGSPSEEVTQYLAEPVRTADPLEWWREHKKRFTTIAQLARRYLAIPATSVSYKSGFSEGGLTVARKRRDLEMEAIDSILFLHGNFRYIKDLDSIAEMPNQIAVKVSAENATWPSVMSLASVKSESGPSTSYEQKQVPSPEVNDTVFLI